MDAGLSLLLPLRSVLESHRFDRTQAAVEGCWGRAMSESDVTPSQSSRLQVEADADALVAFLQTFSQLLQFGPSFLVWLR